MMKDEQNAKPAEHPLDLVVMCSFLGCDKAATVRLKVSGADLCDTHYQLNIKKYGRDLGAVPLSSTGA